jgi:hypothetical protein
MVAGLSEFEVVTRGGIDDGDRGALAAAVKVVLERHDGVEGPVRMRLTGAPRPGGPGLVQINLTVAGRPTRIEVPGRTVAGAVHLAASRLCRQLDRLTGVWRVWPWPDPQRRPLGLPDAGAVVRHKPYQLEVCDPDQAALVLGAMDYDAHLFTDRESGEDAVVYRSGPSGLRLARQRSMHPPAGSTEAMTVSAHRVPMLRPREAARWLADGWLPFLFFTDRASGRGRLLYRRYDGGLGLISGR